MRLSKPNKLIGLDIGSHAIKICQIDQTSRNFLLEHYGQANLPPAAIEDGLIKDHQAVADTLSRLIHNLGIQGDEAVLALAGYSVIVKKITLPILSEKELAQTIHLEAEQHLPFDVREVNLDFHILGPLKDEPDTMAVLLVAGKKDVLESYLKVTRLAGVEVRVVDIVAFALENAYEGNYPLSAAPRAVIDLGSDLITVNVFNASGPLFTRDLSMGGRQITEQIQALNNLSFKDAENLKLSWERPVGDLERLGALLLPVLRTWTEEIKRAFDFLAASDPESRPEKVFLAGGTALLPGLTDFFQQELKLPVELFNPFQKVKINPELFDPAYLSQIAPQAATAFGLALRRRDDR